MSLTYASLLSPLMDSTGLISTTALNSTAQTALEAGTYASAEVDVLKITALQESGGNYLGLPATNITARGKFVSQPLSRGRAFESPGFGVGETGNLACQAISTAISPGVYASVACGQITATQCIAPIFSNSSNSFLTDSLGNCTVNQLNYTTLNPPLPAEVIPTLSQVLTAGNVASTDIDLNGGDFSIVGADQVYADHFRTAGNNLTGLEGSILTLASQSTNTLGTIQAIDNDLFINPCAEDLEVGNVNFSNKSISNVKSLTIGDALGSYAQIVSPTGDMICGTVNTVTVGFKPTYDYYVAKGGSDTSDYGSIISPYLTIQKAITECELQIDGVPRVIHVSGGSFTENLTFSKSRISVKGQGVGTHPDIGTSITGTITINITDGNSDLNNNNITLSGFLIVGSIDDSTAGNYPHRLIVNNCHIYGNDRCLYIHPVFDYRCFVSNCVISNDNLTSTDPLVQCAGIGMVSFNQTQMTAKGASQIVFKLSSTCRIDVFAQNILTSDSVGTNVAVAIFNHNSTQTITLGQNAFVYGNSGAKRNSETASGVFMNNTGSLVLLSNTFVMTGLASSQMAVYATTLAFPTTLIIFGANVSTSTTVGLTATGISGTQGTTKYATQSVQ